LNRQKDTIRLVAVTGNGRSGTTALNSFLNTHGDALFFFEFGLFIGVGAPVDGYLSKLRRDWMRRRILRSRGARGLLSKLDSAIFLNRLDRKLRRLCGNGTVEMTSLRRVLSDIFPECLVIGDKRPSSMRTFHRICSLEGISVVVIYRDCRDVVSSAIKKVAREKLPGAYARGLDRPDVVAKNWVEAMRTLERYGDRENVHAVRYEDLVSCDEETICQLGEFLNLDPAGFRKDALHSSSVGKHLTGLSPVELPQVLEVASGALTDWGYSV
jgi:hypothetical protein